MGQNWRHQLTNGLQHTHTQIHTLPLGVGFWLEEASQPGERHRNRSSGARRAESHNSDSSERLQLAEPGAGATSFKGQAEDPRQ